MDYSNKPLIKFATNRIQKEERIPKLKGDEWSRIEKGLNQFDEINKENKSVIPIMKRMLTILEGICAKDSVPFFLKLLEQYPDIVKESIARGKGCDMRLQYIDRLFLLLNIFDPMRLDRVSQTAYHIGFKTMIR